MAFQQPTRQVFQRVARPPAVDDHGGAAPSPQRPPVESQSWVLFSAPTDVTTTSYLSGTEGSLLNPVRSLQSDLASANTVARAARQPGAPCPSAVDDEDDAELDSLNSHLAEFRSLPGAQDASQNGYQHSLPVLPAHDGLGSFRLADQPVLGRDARNQIYQFERFNPRRVRRRLDSFSRGQFYVEHGQHQEEEKRLRIEEWRLDHSRMLMDQVQRETRRRRKSQASLQRVRRPETDDMAWHDGDHVQPDDDDGAALASITRKVVGHLLGIDDRLVPLLLGGSLPGDTATPTGPQQHHEASSPQPHEQSWQPRLLERLSRELGLLFSRFSYHPGAFSTRARVQQPPLPYAGLPVILEAPSCKPTQEERPSAPEFHPTMRRPSQPVPMSRAAAEESGDEAREDSTFTQEE